VQNKVFFVYRVSVAVLTEI